ncbi:MAG: MFS transporter [Actinomycetota bacterium]|nr:MFS transporter [Actinomycetota bacterium]
MRRTTLFPNMPRRVWILFAGDLVSFVGNGLVIPFLIVYLHRVRHLALPTAGLALSTIAVAGFIATVVTGGLVDRIGPRKTLILSQVAAAAGAAAIAFVHSPWQAFAAAAIYGVGAAGYWPAIQSLLATAVPPEQRDGAFSLHFMALNAGIGLGAVIGGAVVTLAQPTSFVHVYLVDAMTFLAFGLLLTRMMSFDAPPQEAVSETPPTAGYAQVLKDRVFVKFCLVMALLVTIGTAQLTSGFPAFATGRGAASTHVLGFAFGANTLTIVVIQLWVLRAMKGHRRTRLVMGTCLMWALCWLLTLFSGLHGGGVPSAAGFIAALAVFAAGETLMAPSIPALVNHLAPEHLRGRYNALHSLAFNSGFFVGPAIAGFVLGAGAGAELFVGLILGCGLVAALLWWLEGQIPEDANRIRETDAAFLSPEESLEAR